VSPLGVTAMVSAIGALSEPLCSQREAMASTTASTKTFSRRGRSQTVPSVAVAVT